MGCSPCRNRLGLREQMSPSRQRRARHEFGSVSGTSLCVQCVSCQIIQQCIHGDTPCHGAMYGLVSNDDVEISACALQLVGVNELEKRAADETVGLLLKVIREDRVGEKELEIRVEQSPICGCSTVRGPTRRRRRG